MSLIRTVAINMINKDTKQNQPYLLIPIKIASFSFVYNFIFILNDIININGDGIGLLQLVHTAQREQSENGT